MISIALAILTVGGGGIIALIKFAANAGRWAENTKSTIDTHGNAIGEHKRRLDAHEELHKEHIQKIANLEGQTQR